MSKIIDDKSLIQTILRLQDVFRHTSDPAAAVKAVGQIIGDVNIVDPTERESSIWRNRPLHMVLQSSKAAKPNLTKIKDGWKKDWNAKPAEPPPKKDWSKLAR